MSQENTLFRYQSSIVTDPHTAQDYYTGRELQIYTPQSNAFQTSTTNKDVYVQHELPRRLPPPETQKRPSVPLDASTTYGRHFPRHQIESKPPNRPHTAAAYTTPFEGRSSYADTFVKHEINLTSRPPPPQPRPAVKFDGSSTYHSSFPQHTIESRPHKEPSRPSANKIPLDATTSYGIFTTSHDNQREICVLIFQGNSQMAPSNRLIGQFDLVGIPEAPKGHPQIEVTFQVDRDDVLTVSAVDLSCPERQQKWLLEGDMIARPLTQDVEVLTEPKTQNAIRAH
ncbi:hypothetical protein BSKO_02205 [Bryopsis sp. KO-2023]|nr:hypothetical protein BSKO_02205 [Bryopsis sp. KO-2023]